MYIYTYMYMYLYSYIYINIHLHIYIYLYLHVYNIDIYTWICTTKHAHTYTYTRIKVLKHQLHSHSTQQYYQHADMCGFLTWIYNTRRGKGKPHHIAPFGIYILCVPWIYNSCRGASEAHHISSSALSNFLHHELEPVCQLLRSPPPATTTPLSATLSAPYSRISQICRRSPLLTEQIFLSIAITAHACSSRGFQCDVVTLAPNPAAHSICVYVSVYMDTLWCCHTCPQPSCPSYPHTHIHLYKHVYTCKQTYG